MPIILPIINSKGFTLLPFFIVLLSLSACVPAKKYKDLLEREKVCSEELAKFKKSSGEYESLSKDLQTKFANASRDLSKLIQDTTALGSKYRLLLRDYGIIDGEYKSLQKSFDKLKNMSARETAELQNQLEAKNNELQIKEDALLKLDQELKEKQRLLIEREKRVNELEEAIRKKEAAVQLLKAKVANALRGFENQGLSVVQKNGKIYVSLEAKLLFKSGSTFVDEEYE